MEVINQLCKIFSVLFLSIYFNNIANAGMTVQTIPGDIAECTQSCMYEVYPYAILSEAAYEGIDLPSYEDWYRIDPIYVDRSGFRAVLYENQIKNELVISFAGSDEFTDYIDDVAQFFGRYAEQYEQGVQLAMAHIIQQARNDNYSVTLIGHSLGGGIAQFVASILGLKAYTFNPAPVNMDIYTDVSIITDTLGIDDSNILNVITYDEKGKYDIVPRIPGILLGTTKFLIVQVHDLLDGTPGFFERHAIKTIIDILAEQIN